MEQKQLKMTTTKTKNPLSKMGVSKQVLKMFGEKTGKELLTKPVFKYTHKGLGEGLGDLRK